MCRVHATYINEHLEHEPNDASVDRRDKLIGKSTAWVMLPYKYHTTIGKPYLKSGAEAGQQFPADGTHPHQARQCGDRQAAERQ